MDHCFPVIKIRFRTVNTETFADNLCQFLFLESQRCFIKYIHIQILDNIVNIYVAEKRNLVFDAVIQRQFGTADNDIRLKAESLKILDSILCWFCFHFTGGFDIWNQGNMNQHAVLAADFMLELTDRFQKWLTFDISDSTANFNDSDFGFTGSRVPIKTALNGIGDMRNNLNSTAAVITTSFAGKDIPINLAACYVGAAVEGTVDKTFIMSEIQVCFGTIISDENFSVLIWIHCTRVNIQVWIEFLHGDKVTAGFQKSSERSGCDTLT